MKSPGDISAKSEASRQQSKATWNAVAPGWYAQREELWKISRPVSEWMIRRQKTPLKRSLASPSTLL
jgi:hypothetical protein